MASVSVIASKEFSDIIRSKRFIILLSIFALLMIAAVASTYISATQGIAAPTAMPRGFLLSVASNLTSMMAYFAPILGIVLGVDAVSGEREKGTLKMVLAQPVFRDTFINGKFLGTVAAISLAVCIAFLVNVGGSIIALGITPTGDDAARLFLFLIISIIYAVAYYGIAILISTVSKKTTVSVIASIMIWAVFTFILPIIATMVVFSITPIRIQPGQNMTITPELREEIRRRITITETVNMFTPNYHFNRAANNILRAYIGAGFMPEGGATSGRPLQQAIRAVSIIESLAMVWPNILVIALIAVFTLIATYMLFVRQETR
ncbi:MAG: ABC transporter permease subunit [Candidatus Bathyarchaeia archaeon]|nr:ABC transporter permease [Candidatus Bathyarchaeota archaeon]